MHRLLQYSSMALLLASPFAMPATAGAQYYDPNYGGLYDVDRGVVYEEDDYYDTSRGPYGEDLYFYEDDGFNDNEWYADDYVYDDYGSYYGDEWYQDDQVYDANYGDYYTSGSDIWNE